jgi:hypothetical protein
MNTFENYVLDLGNLLKRDALSTLQHHATAAPTDKSFWDGKLLAYNEVLSLMLSQAKAFGVDPKRLGLDGFDPDKDL